eukprot:CAMPEP_0172791828 /NCGR_PEP_ID=MMETSP1074-20121228/208665_1 /TAXON_ID=2916 /ORGANISM="Ceratium fusus, Strain PA161109" /LENGTH=52 /DNA_ID=CAMNT_0013628889 /DNA_START=566 /DNA_END=724 /DNA_ORIENTATION=-
MPTVWHTRVAGERPNYELLHTLEGAPECHHLTSLHEALNASWVGEESLATCL